MEAIKLEKIILQLHNGTNTFKAEADEGAEHLILSIFYYNNYEAV